MAYPAMQDKQNIPLKVTCISEDSGYLKLSVQMDFDLVRRIDGLIQRMKGDLERSSGFLHRSQLRTNVLCCAKSPFLRKWCRAQVLPLPVQDGTQVAVRLVDYGTLEFVSVGDIAKADESLLALPYAATDCILADVMSYDKPTWSAEALNFCEQNLLFQEVLGSFIGRCENSTILVLRIAKIGTTSLFSDVLVDKGFAIPLARRPPLVYNGDTYKAAHLDINKEYLVYVSYTDSPQKFYIQLQATESDLNMLMERIEFYVNNKKTQCVQHVLPGTPCLTQFSEDRVYYRALVTAVDGKNCHVMFVDYGNSEVKLCSELIAIPQEFLTLQAQAIECTLQANSGNVSTLMFRAATDSKLLSCFVVDREAKKYIVMLNYGDSNILQNNQNYSLYKSLHLPAESTNEVFVISIHNPLKFYCQLSKSKEHISNLMSALNKENQNYAVNFLSLKECHPRRPVCFRKPDVGNWYRAEIISVDDSNINVWLVDYGFSQVTTVENLRKLNSNMQQLPVQALKFSLYGFDNIPREVLGSHKVIAKFEELALEKNVFAQVKSCCADGAYKVILHSVEGRSQVCINDELKKMLTVINSNSVFPKLSKVENIYVTFFNSPSDFFGQLTRFSVKELEIFQDNLNEFYNTASYSGYQPQIGEVICAKYSEDNTFYRGRVTAICRTKYSIDFLDHGGHEEVESLNIRYLQPQFLGLPAQGIKCSFSHCPPSVPVEKLHDLMLENTFQVSIEEEANGTWIVTLTETYAGNAPILEFIRQHGTEVSTCTLQLPFINIGAHERVFITDASSNGMWCQLQKNSDALDNIMEEMNQRYNQMLNQDKLSPRSVAPGTYCVAKYSVDEEWYRAVILSCELPGKAKIRFVDYGNEEFTTINNLKNLQPEFSELPEQAVRCVLARASPLDNSTLQSLVEKEFTAVFKGQNAPRQAYIIELLDESGNLVGETAQQKVAKASEWEEPSTDSRQADNWKNSSVAKKTSYETSYQKEKTYSDSRSDYHKNRSPLQPSEFREKRSSSAKKTSWSSSSSSADENPNYKKRRPKAADYFQSGSEDETFRSDENSKSAEGRMNNQPARRSYNDRPPPQRGNPNKDFKEDEVKAFGPSSKGNSPLHQPKPNLVVKTDYECLPLAENVYRDIAVVFVCSPSEFYCHLVENSSQLLTLMDDISDTYTNLKATDLLLNKPKVGSPCCVIFSEDSAWYRGKILNVSNNLVEVQFVDYGNSEKTSRSNIRALKPNFLSLPVQAIKCSLYNTLPQGTSWTLDDVAKFEEMTKDKCLVAQFLTKQHDGTYHVNLINVDKLRDGILNKEFIDLGHGRTLNAPKSVFCNSHMISANITLPDPAITCGDKMEVLVTWLLNYTEYYCQLTSYDDQFNTMMQEIQEYYSNLEDMKDVIEIPQVNMVCAAQFKEDNCWYRAKIAHMKGSLVGVHYVDYGNSEEVTRKRVKYLLPQFTQIPIQVVKCRMKGVKCCEDGSSTVDENIAAKYFSDKINCTFLESCENYFLTELEKDGKDVASQLIDSHLVLPDSSAPSIASQESSQESLKSSSLPADVSGKQIGIPPMVLSTKQGEYFDVVLSYIESPTSFWCQLQSGQSQIEELMSVLDTYYSDEINAPENVFNPVCGSACVAKFTDDDTWYRAVVKSCPSSSDVEVMFVDYGNSEVLQRSRTKEISPEHVLLPSQAFKCSLFGVPSDVSPEQLEKLEEMIDKELVAKVENFTNELITITLFDTSSGEEVNVGESIFGPLELADKADVTKIENDIEDVKDYSTFPPLVIPEGKHAMYVSHINNCKDFFVQPVASEDHLNNLSALLEELYNGMSEPNVPADIVIGMACCTQFSEDQQWYRAEVVDIEGDLVKVRFIDYGNAEVIPKEKILSLDPEFLVQPPFAVPCQLEIETTLEYSPEELNEMVFSGFDEKVFQVTFNTTTLPAKVFVEDDNGDVRQYIPCPESEKKLTIDKYHEINIPDENVEVTVSFVYSLEKFYVNFTSQEDKLASLGNELDEFYEKNLDDHILTDVKVGQPCAGKFSEDDSWYRAIVRDINDDNLTLQYVDYGNSEIVDRNSIRTLAAHFLEEAPMALECSLHGVKVIDEMESDAKTKFEEITNDTLLLEVCKKEIPVEVHLLKDEINIAEQLIQEELCINVSSVIEDTHISTLESVPSSKHSLPIGKTPVRISHVESFDKFYVIPYNIYDDLHKLHSKLQEAYSCSDANTAALTPFDIKLSYLYAAKFSRDNQWYRGIVTAVNENEITVFFIDYGNTEEVSSSDLAELSHEFTAQLPFAMPYTVYGVDIVKDSHELVKGRLCDFVNGKECIVGVFNAEAPHYEKIICDKTDIIEQLLQEGLLTVSASANDVESSIGDEIRSLFEEREIYKYPQRSIPIGEMTASISHVQISESIYVYMTPADLNDRLTALQTSMQSAYHSSGDESSQCSEIYVSQLCAINLNGAFHRASVSHITREVITVKLIDIGSVEAVSGSALRNLLPELAREEPFAVWCALTGVSLMKEKNEAVETRLQQLLINKELVINVLDRQGNSNESPYTVKVSIGGKDIVEQLMDEGLLERQTQLLVNVYQKLEPSIGHRVEATISHCVSPSEFWIQLTEHQDELSAVMEQMSDIYSCTSNEHFATWSVNQPCVAQYSEDDQWYRAEIISTNKDSAVVSFVDYGNKEEVSNIAIKQIDAQFINQIPAQAIKCSLFNVIPMSASKWNADACDLFEELVGTKTLLVEFKRRINDTFIVTLLDMGINVGNQLIDQGHALNYEKRQLSSSESLDDHLWKEINTGVPLTPKYLSDLTGVTEDVFEKEQLLLYTEKHTSDSNEIFSPDAQGDTLRRANDESYATTNSACSAETESFASSHELVEKDNLLHQPFLNRNELHSEEESYFSEEEFETSESAAKELIECSAEEQADRSDVDSLKQVKEMYSLDIDNINKEFPYEDGDKYGEESWKQSEKVDNIEEFPEEGGDRHGEESWKQSEEGVTDEEDESEVIDKGDDETNRFSNNDEIEQSLDSSEIAEQNNDLEQNYKVRTVLQSYERPLTPSMPSEIYEDAPPTDDLDSLEQHTDEDVDEYESETSDVEQKCSKGYFTPPDLEKKTGSPEVSELSSLDQDHVDSGRASDKSVSNDEMPVHSTPSEIFNKAESMVLSKDGLSEELMQQSEPYTSQENLKVVLPQSGTELAGSSLCEETNSDISTPSEVSSDALPTVSSTSDLTEESDLCHQIKPYEGNFNNGERNIVEKDAYLLNDEMSPSVVSEVSHETSPTSLSESYSNDEPLQENFKVSDQSSNDLAIVPPMCEENINVPSESFSEALLNDPFVDDVSKELDSNQQTNETKSHERTLEKGEQLVAETGNKLESLETVSEKSCSNSIIAEESTLSKVYGEKSSDVLIANQNEGLSELKCADMATESSSFLNKEDFNSDIKDGHFKQPHIDDLSKETLGIIPVTGSVLGQGDSLENVTKDSSADANNEQEHTNPLIISHLPSEDSISIDRPSLED